MATDDKFLNNNLGDEIDLLSILSKIIQVFFKYIWFLITLGLIGGGIGLINAFTTKPVYATKMVIESKVIGYAEISSLLEPLEELIDEDNFSAIGKKLGISEDMAESLRGIKAINILQEEIGHPDKDFVESEKVSIQVKVVDNKILPVLEKNILVYLENNPYIKSRIALEAKHLNLQIKELEKELKNIDSLKKDIQSLIKNPQNATVYLSDLGELYGASKSFYQEKLKLEYELNFAKKFQVLSGFTPFTDPVSLGKLARITIGGAAGFVIWVLIVIVLEVMSLIQSREE